MRTRGMMVLGLLLAGAVVQADYYDVNQHWKFDGDATGVIARGFTGETGEWKVVASDRGNALAQMASNPDEAFNVALVDGIKVKDLALSVQIKAIAGEFDQGGGLVWRAKDAKNYYIARFNHLEDNFRVYKVVEGTRTMLQSADVKHHDGWTTLAVSMMGDQIACSLDEKLYLDVKDSTFPDAGKVGLWSKSDARTQFDDLGVRGD